MRARCGMTLMCALVMAATALAQPQRPQQPQQPQQTQPRTASAAQPRTPAAPRASADQTPPPPPPPPPVAGPGTRRQGQPVNIKVEFTLTDQRGTAPPITRTISLVVADAHTGMVRSQSQLYQRGDVPLNVDTTPEILADGKVRVGFNIQYDWPAPPDAQGGDRAFLMGSVTKTALHDSVSLILESGKPMIAAQSADPIGDRQVTVEVKATVLK